MNFCVLGFFLFLFLKLLCYKVRNLASSICFSLSSISEKHCITVYIAVMVVSLKVLFPFSND